MFTISTYNKIAENGLQLFPKKQYKISEDAKKPDAIVLRSHVLDNKGIDDSVKAIARAGAGTNNIPVEYCTEKGITVFNTPGANANAVKELVLSGMLLSSRGILEGIQYVSTLGIKDNKELKSTVEAQKKNYKGQELYGKTLGVVGLGAIGSLVAEMGLKLGMKVLGFDPGLSVDAAWRLSSQVKKMNDLSSLLSKSDYVTLHLPLLEGTKDLIGKKSLGKCKKGMRLLNFSREGIVNEKAVVKALKDKKFYKYITDFPTPELLGCHDVILMPHIGASTKEAEENCAVMAVSQLIDFLENGNIKNSVNFPTLFLERTSQYRIALTNKNIPKMLGQILSILADRNINIVDMLNKSRDEIAYNLIDIETQPSDKLLKELIKVEGVINVRKINSV